MEWITVTAPSVSEAKEQLLDKLGVPDGDAEFEIVEEAESKFFGLRRTEAVVRARVRPQEPEPRRDRKRRTERKKGAQGSGGSAPKRVNAAGEDGGQRDRQRKANSPGNGKSQAPAADDPAGDDAGGEQPAKKRRRRRRGGGKGDGSPQTSGGAHGDRTSGKRRQDSDKETISMEQAEANLQEFIDGLTDAFGIDAPASITETDGDLLVDVPGNHGVLIGPKARTLDAIQELARIAAFKGSQTSARIKIDVGSYRQKRADALASFAVQAAEKATSDSTEVVLEPMSAADRKVVHDALSGVDGVETRSVGDEPRRRVVIVPSA